MNIIEDNTLIAKISEALADYESITLENLEADHLMSRWDEKFVFHAAQLPSFLSSLTSSYKVLAVNNKKVSLYNNTYFDTPGLQSFHEHHNENANRWKVRFRQYESSGACFLEIKRKDNRRFTTKERLQVDTQCNELNAEQLAFLSGLIKKFQPGIQPSLINRFTRITLVSEESWERVTLDLMIHFKSGEIEKELGGMAIAEVKQEHHYYGSAFKKLMQEQRIFPVNISKYCMGIVLTHPGIRHNRFKPKLNKLNKIYALH